MPQLRIGISGWRYAPWRGTFYPTGLPQKRELQFAARQFNSIEINGSFYSLQRATSWQQWHDETPADFLFSVKGSRYITHMKRLNDIQQPLANFFAQGLLALRAKLGPILWQFPPNFAFNDASAAKLEAFFDLLPRDTAAAAALARHHDSRINGKPFLNSDKNRPLRHAIEIRHDSFKSAAFLALLRRHHIALVVADTAGKWPFVEDLTADFVYARLHGDEQLYVSGYTPEALDAWATRVHAWKSGREIPNAIHASDVHPKPRKSRDVFLYFDNDVKVRAPVDAIALAQRTGGFIPSQMPAPLDQPLAEEARTSWPAIRKSPAKRRR